MDRDSWRISCKTEYGRRARRINPKITIVAIYDQPKPYRLVYTIGNFTVTKKIEKKKNKNTIVSAD